MKVGGNESATKFFQSNGGTAALNSKDVKVKYTSNAANKYKEELKRRSARDAEEYVETSLRTATTKSLQLPERSVSNGRTLDKSSRWILDTSH